MYLVNTKDSQVFLRKEDILCCLAEGSYSKIVLKSRKSILVSKNLKSIEKTLIDDTFLRVHRSHIVNLEYVKSFDKRTNLLTIEDNEELIVTQDCIPQLLSKFVLI